MASEIVGAARGATHCVATEGEEFPVPTWCESSRACGRHGGRPTGYFAGAGVAGVAGFSFASGRLAFLRFPVVDTSGLPVPVIFWSAVDDPESTVCLLEIV